MKKIIIDKNLCMNCLNCSLACMSKNNPHSNNIYDLDLSDESNESMNHIALNSIKSPTPLFCRHCEDPECVKTCISGALTKNKETGYVEYDPSKCASCYMCVLYCEYGILKPSESKNKGKKILKCDMCKDREMPECVKHCPTGAIRYEEVENEVKKA